MSRAREKDEETSSLLPKGNCYLLPISFDSLTQADVDTTMSRVNSYVRPALGDKVPYDLFTNKFGTDVADLFKPHLTFTLPNSVEVDAKSVKVNAHRHHKAPKLWAFTLTADRREFCREESGKCSAAGN